MSNLVIAEVLNLDRILERISGQWDFILTRKLIFGIDFNYDLELDEVVEKYIHFSARKLWKLTALWQFRK